MERDNKPRLGFLDLSPEIRIQIYELLYCPIPVRVQGGWGTPPRVQDHLYPGVAFKPVWDMQQIWNERPFLYDNRVILRAPPVFESRQLNFEEELSYNPTVHMYQYSTWLNIQNCAKVCGLLLASKTVYHEAMSEYHKQLTIVASDGNKLYNALAHFQSCDTLQFLRSIQLSIMVPDSTNMLLLRARQHVPASRQWVYGYWKNFFKDVKPGFLRLACPSLYQIKLTFTRIGQQRVTKDHSKKLAEFLNNDFYPKTIGSCIPNVKVEGLIDDETKRDIIHALSVAPPLPAAATADDLAKILDDFRKLRKSWRQNP